MRPFNRNANVGRGGGGGNNGPLMSDPLRDLDLELELLKRKRKMIEEQQNLLNQQQGFNRVSYNYEQPQSFRNHQPFDDGPQFSGSNHAFSSSSRDSNSNRDFTHLYNEPQQSHNHFPWQSAEKRLGDYVWSDPPHQAFSYEPPAKKPFPQPKKFKSGPGGRQYVPPSERPGFASKKQSGRPAPNQRFNEASKRPKPNDFKPTKVTKPYKPAYQPNKPAYQPNKPAYQQNKPAYPKPSTHNPSGPRVNENSPILHADQIPAGQTVGRLECALGTILKIVKDKYGSQPAYAHCFSEQNAAREMKQLIRERIRETMLGKPVGNLAQIMQMYRAVYPIHTDKDIVEAGIKKKDIVTDKNTTFNMASGNINPFQFFKTNYTRLMSVSLNKMFARLETIAKEESALLLKSENQGKEKTESSNGTEEVVDKTEDTEPTKDDEAIKDDAGNTEGNVENPAENVENPAENVENPAENAEKPAENSEIPAENAENPVENAEKLVENAEKPKTNTKIEETEEERAINAAIREKYETMIDDVMMRKLTTWLPRLKTQIMRVLAHDLTFERAKQAIIKETKERLNMANEPIQPGSDISKHENTIVNKTHKLDYHVKILGQPTLPSKGIMTEFLQPFNPKHIKKVTHVLLYVGFDNKADFDRMVAANGSLVGNVKITVKISQRVTSSALNASSGNTSTPNTSALSDKDVTMQDADNSKENNENDEGNKDLNDILDNQIDELLTSIRNDEESENVEGNNEEVQQGVGDEQQETEKDAPENQESEILEENAENDVELFEPESKVINLDEDDTKNEEMEVTNQEEKDVWSENDNKNEGTQETNQEEDVGSENVTETDEAKDKVDDIKTKETGKATPIRASTRLANAPSTPSSIRTRRASKLGQN